MKKSSLLTLNAYLSRAGVCSRRKAVELIESGAVRVNEQVMQEPGYRVQEDDVVTVSGKHVMLEEHVYILLNKPKDYVTTVADEKGRRTVMDLIGDAVPARVYPVGRLDRATTGLLVLTNDGAFAQQLAHPKYEVTKIYTVVLDNSVSMGDMNRLLNGIQLEDGIALVDEITYSGQSKKGVTLSLHSGKYRIVRRLFEELGYKVRKLDRVGYAGLTKKGLPVGAWRYLTKQEVARLRSET